MATSPLSSLSSPTSDGGGGLLGESTASVSASVGHDTWASEVISRVEKDSWAEESLTERIRELKRKFHAGRALELKNLPEGVDEQDIRDSFPDLSITSVLIERNDGRYKPGAKVYLSNPGDVLDEWPKSRSNVFVKNKEVSVCIGGSDGWLCVAKLPTTLTESAFQALASSYGKVKEAFLMISEKTGESKGYGLIKYMNSDAAAQARHLLDGRELESYFLDCDWLNSARITFASLHSKCLYVNHLPANYRDMGEFRKRFSVVKNPPYCQIAMKNGVIQNWGLVEFFDHEEAEDTRDRMNGCKIHNTPIRVHYCIPGVNAINIYMQVVNAPEKKKALLHDAPSANVYSQLQKLAKQNPSFAQNLQNIIQEQIASISSNGISSGTTPPTSNGGSTERSNSDVVISRSTTQSPPAVPVNPNLNANAQAALMILLTAQMQSETGEVSLLQNPQVVGILQNLVSQAGTKTTTSSNGASPSLSDLLSDPVLSSVLHNNNRLQKVINKENRPSLLENSGVIKRPSTLLGGGEAPPSGNAYNGSAGLRKDPPSTPPLSNSFNSLLNTQNLSELLGSLSTPPSNQQQQAAFSEVPHMKKAPPSRPVLIQEPPPPTLYNRQLPVVSTAPSLLPQPPIFSTQLQMIPAGSHHHFSLGIPPGSGPYYINTPGFIPPHSQPPYIPGIPIITTLPGGGAHHPHHHPPFLLPSPASPNSSSSSPSSVVSNSLFTSPSQLKRKLPIPPSPEQSPEGPYIGQHSQGLGGHYADSYWRNKRSRFH